MSEARLNELERKVLRALVSADDYCGFCYLSFKGIRAKTRLGIKEIRRACRSLTRKGLAEYGRGLWTEDGEPAGSGYAASRAARSYASHKGE
jgi:hypothetical protein